MDTSSDKVLLTSQHSLGTPCEVAHTTDLCKLYLPEPPAEIVACIDPAVVRGVCFENAISVILIAQKFLLK